MSRQQQQHEKGTAAGASETTEIGLNISLALLHFVKYF
jgi:hypothetical protein